MKNANLRDRKIEPPYYACTECEYIGFRVVFGLTPDATHCPECGHRVTRW